MTNGIREFSGENNNPEQPKWGAANTALLRVGKGQPLPIAYDDEISSPSRPEGPNPRTISNEVCQARDRALNKNRLSDVVWAWGQFVDHEIDLSPELEKKDAEMLDIPVAPGDPALPEGGSIQFRRSAFVAGTGTALGNPRQQGNVLSAFLDASNVYGASKETADELRTKQGGKLKVGENNLLPWGTGKIEMANPRGVPSEKLFMAGDVRANEHVVLASLHTLFVREHNRICDLFAECNKRLSDEELFQRARRYVGALQQVVTYKEFLPALLGVNALSRYEGYQIHVNPGISNLFSTASYRFGHSMVSERIRVENELGTLALRNVFFEPQLLIENGIEPFLAGIAKNPMLEIDSEIAESLRSFLFFRPQAEGSGEGAQNKGAGRLHDLAALNIQRGRDHGLPDYNTCRIAMGLPAKNSIEEISSNPARVAALTRAYSGRVELVDPWVGGLAEDHVPGGNVGELVFAVLKDQFERMRDGDRFWYQNDPALKDELKEISQTLLHLESTTLSQIIERNTNLKGLRENIFYVPVDN